MERMYTIFISSTYDDMREERRKVIDTILRMGHMPVGMEMFSADVEEKWEQIKRTIDEADYYVLLIKRRYGSVSGETDLSFTRQEYEYAKKKKVPVLAFIASQDAPVCARDIENDPEKLRLLQKFIEDVKSDCYRGFWSNPDHLCTLLSNALERQFRRNARGGWVRAGSALGDDELPNVNRGELIRRRDAVQRELVRREGGMALAQEFFQQAFAHLDRSLEKRTFIDRFDRQIVLDVDEETGLTQVRVTTQIDFGNVGEGVPYYSASPRFETFEEAESYEHVLFAVNDEDRTDEICRKISGSGCGRQFSYMVANTLPIETDRPDPRVLHVTRHVVPTESIFQVYQLVFPCRTFSVSAMVVGNYRDRYRVRVGTFTSYNVHTYEDYRSEIKNGDLTSLSVTRWSMPGSGYALQLEKAAEEGAE